MAEQRVVSDVVVVGGGFAGLASGSVLAASGLSVTVIDAGPAASFRGELLHPAGVRALTDLGLRPALLSAGAVPVPGFAAYLNGKPVLIPYPEEGGLGLAMDYGELVSLLRADFLARRGAQLVSGRADEVLVRDGRVYGVRLADGTELRSGLVVVAEGRHSRLRLRLGLPTNVDLLSYTLAPVLDGDLLPNPGYGHVFVGAPGPVLAYPYGCSRVRMCVDVPTGIKGGRRGIIAYLREHYLDYVPEPLRSGMLAAVERGGYEGSANHSVSTDRCVAHGVALVGDAAGCSHPVTATGLTTALNDVTILAAQIREHGLSDDALAEYQRRRYRFARAREVFAQAMYDVLRGSDTGSRVLRQGMFRYWHEGERSRRASLAILSGDASSPVSFVKEYARVMKRSTTEAIHDSALREIPRNVVAMLSVAGGCADLAMERVLATAALEAVRSRAVAALPDASAKSMHTEEASARAEDVIPIGQGKRTSLGRVKGWLPATIQTVADLARARTG